MYIARVVTWFLPAVRPHSRLGTDELGPFELSINFTNVRYRESSRPLCPGDRGIAQLLQSQIGRGKDILANLNTAWSFGDGAIAETNSPVHINSRLAKNWKLLRTPGVASGSALQDEDAQTTMGWTLAEEHHLCYETPRCGCQTR